MKIHIVAWVNYAPPMIDSVWSTRPLALKRQQELQADWQHGVIKIYEEEVDSGKFKLQDEM